MKSAAQTQVEISGAGPSGLAAAIVIAKGGGHPLVYENNSDVGGRFHGDFQGLENWTSREDVLEELGRPGIEATFEHTPYRDTTFFDSVGREYTYHSDQPLFYLVRRGPQPGTLDASLKAQAVAAGVEIRFGQPCRRLPEGGIVAEGPTGSDAIAVGYVFDTEMADAAFGALSDNLAPKGYSYLLIHKGRGTVASCMMDDYHRDKEYLARTVEFFKQKTSLRMTNPRPFGGKGNFLAPRSARKERMLYVGRPPDSRMRSGASECAMPCSPA